MSIEDAVKELTAAIKELTSCAQNTRMHGEQTRPVPVSLSQSESVTSAPTPNTSDEPQSETPASTSKTKSSVKKEPEASRPNVEPPAKMATYEDAAVLLIQKDKTARQDLVKSFKEGAVKLAELADLGDDIWSRVIEAAKDLPEKQR